MLDDVGHEADALLADAPLDDLLQAGEGAAADEQHVGRVDREELLLRVLAPALRRHVGDRALEDLEQRLLHALARDVARDRGVLGLAGDLVDLVDVDDAVLGALDVEVGGLDELEEDVLDVLADVAGLGQRGGVGDGEGHVEDARQRLGEQRLAAAGRAEEQDVALLQLDVGSPEVTALDALVVVVDRDRQRPLGPSWPTTYSSRMALISRGLGRLSRSSVRRRRELLVDDLVAQLDALVADVDAGTGDELLDLPLRLPQNSEQLIVAVGRSANVSSYRPTMTLARRLAYRCAMTSSMRPYALASSAVMK